jgi:CRISPR-associated exonuclease Cas4
VPTFAALAQAAYCPRKLFYRREEGRAGPAPPGEPDRLARRYPDLLAEAVDPDRLGAAPRTVAGSLATARETFPMVWPGLLDPAEENVELAGRDCTGRVSKLIETTPPTVTIATGGRPPSHGVWHHQSVRAVAAGLALAQTRTISVDRVLIEYPRYGVIRAVPMTAPRRAAYRRTLAAVRTLERPPPRTDNTAKCRTCEYRDTCGVPARSLRSLLS